jgi:hypothetical protein
MPSPWRRRARFNRGMTRRLRTCLVTIARDEASRIGRLLTSVAPWVDDMLVLDTGSSDDTVAVAARAGARVERHAWCDDFAAARNVALAHAGGDWHLVLDADEWLIDGGAALLALTHLPADFVGALQVEDHEHADPSPTTAAFGRAWLSRLLPGTVRYAGRIHEQPVHRMPVRRLPLRVGHDGYGAAARAAKRGRNRRLLETALAADPGDAYLWYQLGKDAQVYEDHTDAEAAFARAAAIAPPHAPWWDDLVARRLFGLGRIGRHAEALDVWRALRARGLHAPQSPDVSFALGDLLLDWAARQPARAAELLAGAEAAWQHCLALGERPERATAVPGRGSHLAAYNLALLYEGTGRADLARRLRTQHGLDPAPLLT